jgi:hypothetical protein
MAWQEGRSTRQTDDIYDMMIAHYLNDPESKLFDFETVDHRAEQLGEDVLTTWRFLNQAAREFVEQNR